MKTPPTGRTTRPGRTLEDVGAALRGTSALRPRRFRVSRRLRFRAGHSLSFMAVGAVALLVGRGWSQKPLPLAVLPDASTEVAFPAKGLPIEVNGRVEKWMKRFMTDQKPSFQLFLGREGIYEDLIRDKLKDRGMPEDLLYLAMIESGYSPKATSKVSAAGVWQFMGPTALQYGLRVDEWVDERLDPVKATDAALDYLDFLHGRYDSWYLAAAAYNAGPARVDRALKRHLIGAGEPLPAGRVGDQDIYWEIIDHLPRETREYVPKILAATALSRQAERYGFKVKAGIPYVYDRVWVPGATSLSKVAKSLGVATRTMREMNPHLVMGWTPPGSAYGLRVPKGSSDQAIAALGGLPDALPGAAPTD